MTQPKKARKKSGLGRGLSALIPDIEAADQAVGPAPSSAAKTVAIDTLVPNPYQPRIRFDEEKLAELADSIKSQGLLQPVLIRRGANGTHEIIAGERRVRASKLAGLTSIPVVIKDLDDRQMLQVSIVENIQRADLDPVEEAESYYRLMNEFAMTQEEVARCVGKSRSAVANFLRLRQLPDVVKEAIAHGAIAMGHARALLGAPGEESLLKAFEKVVARRLSVRETEALIRSLVAPKAGAEPKKPDLPPNWHAATRRIADRFGVDVRIAWDGAKGKIEIPCKDADGIECLLKQLEAAL